MNDGIKNYRKKPVIIQAQKYIGSKQRVHSFIPKDLIYWEIEGDNEILYIKTLESNKHRVSIGDFIIKGVKGEFYACKPDIFEMTYELYEVPTAEEYFKSTLVGSESDYTDLPIPMKRRFDNED
jgi:hypothetical protein